MFSNDDSRFPAVSVDESLLRRLVELSQSALKSCSRTSRAIFVGAIADSNGYPEHHEKA